VGRGVVYLVGAGPGDPGLLTVRAAACLARADFVLADRLVAPEILALVSSLCEVVVRPEGRVGRSDEAQAEIDRCLIDEAKKGRTVVRLKGGDPFVFGRGGEEAAALGRAGVPFEIVPGVTAAVAAPAYAGIPLTHRGVSGTVAFVTGHEAEDKAGGTVDWQAAARAGTAVFYMSLHKLDAVMRRLREAGRPGDTPVALIERGTTGRQRTVVTTIDGAAERAEAVSLEPPALAVVGEVVRLRETLAWFDRRPLFGRRLLVLSTRSAAFVQRDDGVEQTTVSPLLVVPRHAALKEALARLPSTRLIAFTSAHAVDAFFGALLAMGQDARALGAIKLAVVGMKTEERLLAHGLRADVVAHGGAEALAEEILLLELPGPVLHPRAAEGRPELAEGLSRGGIQVDTVAAYDTIPDDGALRQAVRAHRARPFDAIAFMSPLGATAFLEVLGGAAALGGTLVGAIGVTTRDALAGLGIEALTATRPEAQVLCDELCVALAQRGKIG
jgi:uroporphyrinogen III methyltransferase/synthase